MLERDRERHVAVADKHDLGGREQERRQGGLVRQHVLAAEAEGKNRKGITSYESEGAK